MSLLKQYIGIAVTAGLLHRIYDVNDINDIKIPERKPFEKFVSHKSAVKRKKNKRKGKR